MIEVGSITTALEARDSILKGPAFFDALKFSAITFGSESWQKTAEGAYDVRGNLMIRGVIKKTVLKVKVLGFGPGMEPGSKISGWEGTAKLNRRDFGVNGPAMLDNVLGDEVEVSIAIEATLKEAGASGG